MIGKSQVVRSLFAAMCLLAWCASALAGPVEDAVRATQRARSLLSQANSDARQADDELRRLNETLNSAQSRQRTLNQQLDQHKQQRSDMAQRSRDATAALPGLQSALAAAQQSAQAAVGPRDLAQQQHNADLAELARVRRIATDAFHATDAYRKAQSAVASTTAAVADATTICINKLESSPQFRAALQAYDDAVKDLDKSKKTLPPGNPRIVSASQKMIDTDSTVRTMRIDALASDPALHDAKRLAERAAADMRVIESDFEKQVVLQPDMLTAIAASDKSKMLLLVAESKFKQADADRLTADAKLQSARNDIETAKKNLANLDSAIASAQSDLTQLSRTIDDANRRLPAAERARRDAAQKVIDAQRTYDNALANERRVRAQQNK